jgi:hypothetical protein
MVAGVLEVNAVRIDDAQLVAEADQVAHEAAAEAAAIAAEYPPGPTAEDAAEAVKIENAAEGYKILAFAIVGQGAELFVPNWHVTTTEKTDLADALVQALMLWFPDGLIPPKYMALLVVFGIGAKIAFARRDDSGALLPRHATATAPATTATAH